MPGRLLPGLTGSGIQTSPTPALHEQKGEAQGQRVLYRKIDPGVEALGDLPAAAERMGFGGLNPESRPSCPCCTPCPTMRGNAVR